MLVGTVKECAAFLATGESVQQQWQELMPVFFLQNIHIWPALSAMTFSSWVNGPFLVGGIHFLLTPSPLELDRAPLLDSG